MKNIGLYIHIPFCTGKCPYCDFYSVAASDSAMSDYTVKISEKIFSLKGQYHANTVYFGGGTPGLLGTKRLAALLDAVTTAFGTAEEVTVEVNPETTAALDFGELKAHGLNRVSMGLQSGNDNELTLLGRRHSVDDASKAAEKIRREGIENLSLDLMLGISAQTKESLHRSIDLCSSLGARHISAYMLKIEEGTPYYERKSSLALPDEDEVCELYELAVSYLAKHGFRQYEISNFSKPGYESLHNLKYWKCEEYLGLGAAAHSFIDGKRFYYGRSISDFYSDIIIHDGEGGSPEEYTALALRLSRGLRFDEYRARFKEEVPERYIKNARRLSPTGLLTINPDNIALTAKGFLVSNSVISEILFG